MPQDSDLERGEAVCFTAGWQGAAFGAGVIHAWLASDRVEPKVVAGISTGSITAAAMQRAMVERGPEGVRTEASRWGWFQHYLADMMDRPLDVIWKAIPDPVDFFSATIPVRDLSCPGPLKPAERAARYQFWQLTKVGKWIAALPITIGEVGRLGILMVRRAEKIPVPVLGASFLAGWWRSASFYVQAVLIGAQVLHNVIWKPMFTRTWEQFLYDQLKVEGQASDEEGQLLQAGSWIRRIGLEMRPIFGWGVWGLAIGIALAAPGVVASLAALLIFGHYVWLAISLAALVVLASRCGKKSLRKRLREIADRIDEKGSLGAKAKKSWIEALKESAWKAAGIDLGFISNYHLKRRLWKRFFDPNRDELPLVVASGAATTNLVVVASALQSISVNQQVWARTGCSLIDALAAACAVPPLFAPTHITSKQAGQWLRPKDLARLQDGRGKAPPEFDLIDGGALRKNPLPALFNWLQENKEIAESLEGRSAKEARIHVIYNVPIEPFDANQGKPGPERIDLIEAAEVGLLMRARRDTKVEVQQTNFLSDIVNALKKTPCAQPDSKLQAVYADEIAPTRELKFDNPLAPSREESLGLVAEGCRRTLSRLYIKELEEMGGWRSFVPCADLLKRVAPERAKVSSSMAGLPEVCAQCTGQLKPYAQPVDPPQIVKADFGKGEELDLREELPHLSTGERPRIAFVASGGVFRGAFHIGLLGAMQTIGMTPDLVVGASVGTLMGGALAAMRNLEKKDDQLRLLARLSDTFLHVDETVALTVPVKTAVKQLGLRSGTLKLSFAKLRAVVRAGTAKDIGYAATGVPPLLIDTLSELFMIPPSETLDAGSDFLAGRFAKGAAKFIQLLRSRTLDRLEVRYEVIGTSLLEEVARILLGADRGAFELDQRQPYIDYREKKGTAIFCTTAYVNQRWLLVLGRDALIPKAPSFRFLYAALSSSAFPAAFAARSEAEVFPGSGSVTNLFCDGGTFDNLPFVPTLELLNKTQKAAQSAGEDPRESLQKRIEAPDLILCGGFDPLPSKEKRMQFESGSEVSARASALAASVKTASFTAVSEIAAKQLEQLAQGSKAAPHCHLDEATAGLMKGAVIAGVMNIVPTSQEHVNPTFAFARSLGFEPERVAASIADGCFQTLLNLQRRWSTDTPVGRSLRALHDNGVSAAPVELREPGYKGEECPFFKVSCAFHDAMNIPLPLTGRAREGCRQVFEACGADPTHQKLIRVQM